ncbi:MAG: hypothetical protein Q4C87_09445 [Actinomycetaceae bacterium]|nr:hypothetical protein [Actinomycetaceae bacterium]
MNEGEATPHPEKDSAHERRTKAARGALDAAVERCFEVFAQHCPPVFPMDVCSPCCVPAEFEGEIRQMTQRGLTDFQISEFLFAARTDSEPSRGWTNFFLPRILQLYARGQDPTPIAEVGLARLGELDWRDTYPPDQVEALEAFGLAWLRDRLAHYPWEQPGEGPFAALIVMAIGGFDLQQLLAAWLEDDSPSSTLNFVDDWSYGYFYRSRVDNPFLDSPVWVRQFHNWVRNPRVRDTWFGRMMELDPDLVDEYRQNSHFRMDCPDEFVAYFLATDADL